VVFSEIGLLDDAVFVGVIAPDPRGLLQDFRSAPTPGASNY
jgi:hypothetical protein